MEANMHGHMAYFPAGTPSMGVLDDPDLLLINAGLPSDTFNIVCRAQLVPHTLEARIDFAIDHFRSRNLPMAWWVGPTSRPEDLGLHLERHGLTCTEHHTGMAADLHELAVGAPDPPGLTVRPVANRGELRRFSTVISSIFDPPDPAVPLFYEQVADLARMIHGGCCGGAAQPGGGLRADAAGILAGPPLPAWCSALRVNHAG